MVTKDRKTFLVVFSTLFCKSESSKIIVFDVPQDWSTSLLQLFIDSRMMELDLRLDLRPASFIELTENTISNDGLQNYLGSFDMPKNWINRYVKIETSDKFEIFATSYNVSEIRIRSRVTSIIHVTRDKVFNSDTKEIDATVSRYTLTSNTVSSFMMLGDLSSSSLYCYKDLLCVNDIALVFHDVTLGEIVDLSRQLFTMSNELLSTGLLDIFAVDDYGNMYQLSFSDIGINFNICTNTKEDNYYEYGK